MSLASKDVENIEMYRGVRLGGGYRIGRTGTLSPEFTEAYDTAPTHRHRF